MNIAGIEITHPDRVVYPEQGITKADLARHYVRVAPLMLPHVAGRPLSFVRCPAGSGSTCFFQKHLAAGAGTDVRTVEILHKNGETAPYAVVSDVAGLVSMVQHGVLEFHVWGCLAPKVESPDRVVFDLDPGEGVPWANVLEAAFLVRELLRKRELESWAKTTGGKGIHVVIPIARRSSWTEVHDFARDFAEEMAGNYPNDFLSKASKGARTRKIFVDWLRNLRGSTWIAPWSTRSRTGAPVSVPVPWTKLRALTSAAQFTVATIAKQRIPSDAWAAMLRSRQRLR